MTTDLFAQLDHLQQSAGPAAAIDKLVEALRARKDYFNLFDALLLKQKFEMGLPLDRPTSLDDVPDDKRAEFEAAYVDAARTVGDLFLAAGDIPQAWPYLRTIRESDKIRTAIENLDGSGLPYEDAEALVNVALYEGANPPKGLEMLLRAHGTCNAITAFDQTLHQMTAPDQKRSARLLVRHLYDELGIVLRQLVEQRVAAVAPGDSIRELIAGRDWLFGENSYHIDTSHLNSVVRFARALDKGDLELDQAMQLAEYGSKLHESFQYPGDPPFQEFYPAHLKLFHVMSGKDVEGGLEYFRQKLAAEPDERDRRLIAFVLVDLLCRAGREGEAVDVAEAQLKDLDDQYGFSFADLCRRAGRQDALLRVAREKGDLVRYTATLAEA
ncbi:MAG: hypothetical protein WD069_20575 [Planctomycetales bacterium]